MSFCKNRLVNRPNRPRDPDILAFLKSIGVEWPESDGSEGEDEGEDEESEEEEAEDEEEREEEGEEEMTTGLTTDFHALSLGEDGDGKSKTEGGGRGVE